MAIERRVVVRMKAARRLAAARVLAAAGAAAVVGMICAHPASAQDPEEGRIIYETWCAECHGVDGRGDGAAAARMLPRPRDFVQARYQVRTTANGELPTDDDLRAVLELGMPGTAMPSWLNLTDAEREDVIAYIKTLSVFFEDGVPAPMVFGNDTGGGEDALASGQDVYQRLECWKCHGESGRGNGQSAPTLEDWRDNPVRAADLTEPWMFNGGMGVEAIHTRFLTGLDGTPMPAYSDALEGGVVTEEELWSLAHFVAAMAPAKSPRVNELIAARRNEGSFPGSPDDPAWDAVSPQYVPLVGQIIVAPRQFVPTVDGVWVRALHDGEDIAVLLSWSDPSDSPDAAWDEWQARMSATLYSDDPPPAAAPLADGFAIQFPLQVPQGTERPYFLMGDGQNPVYVWHWDSRSGVTARRARGLGEFEMLEPGGLTGEAMHVDGEWRLMFRRSVSAAAEGEGLTFTEGVAIPLGFFAWDGSSAEDVRRSAVSGWYYIYLEAPRSAAMYAVPLIAALIAAGLLSLVIARAQHKQTISAGRTSLTQDYTEASS